MGLDVYFRRDIANVLRATACASEGSMGLAVELLGEPNATELVIDEEKLLQVYRMAVRNTLFSVGLAFGLEPVGPRVRQSVQKQSEVTPGLAGLLWAEVPRDR